MPHLLLHTYSCFQHLGPEEEVADLEEELQRANQEEAKRLQLIDDQTNFCRLRNCTIPLFYFMLGFALRYPTVALRVYMIQDLVAAPAVQSLIVGVVMYLPFSLKIFFAFVSDGAPILGQRRKPYMLGGTVLAAFSWITLGLLDKPGITSTSILLFLSTLGIVWADTMVDTLVVERMRHEHGKQVGSMQTTCWMLRYAGMFIGILMGGWILRYGHAHPQNIFLSLGLALGVILVPAMFPLADEGMRDDEGNELEAPTFSENVDSIWRAVQLNSIWKPMIFVYVWNILPNDGDAWVNYLMGPELRFTEDMYSYILAIGTASGALGAFLYKTCLRNTGLHCIFYSTIIISALLSCIPFILITRENVKWGIPDFVFALGNEVINDVAGFIMYMPVLIMCSKLCPNQVEGSVYALTCVVNNIGSQISMNFSSMLTAEFGITLRRFDRLWELHLVVVLLMFIPLVFVPLTPNKPGEGNPDELQRQVDRLEKKLDVRSMRRRALLASAKKAQADAAASPSADGDPQLGVQSPAEAGIASAAAGEATGPVNIIQASNQSDSESEEESKGETESVLSRRHHASSDSSGQPATASTAATSSDSSDDGDKERESTYCGKCCGSSSTEAQEVEEDEAIDETKVSDEEWRQQEAKMREDLENLRSQLALARESGLPSSAWGGGLFLAVIFGSLIWSTIHAAIRLSTL